MTDAFFTQQQITTEFKHTSADDNWESILVIGKGTRKKGARCITSQPNEAPKKIIFFCCLISAISLLLSNGL
ncbi:hypothetical protein HF563_14970 [Acidithiobacillus ferridurans]|nr:hypothetical protein [Acidithiobacillus ferridurans]